MRKNQTILSLLTLICSVCSLILSSLAFIRSEDTATMVDLQAQNTQLQSQIDKLTARMSGATEAPSNPIASAYGNLLVESYSTVNADGDCLVNLTVTLHLDNAGSDMTFPLPANATDITMSGSSVRTTKTDEAIHVEIINRNRFGQYISFL